ncbi:hypothetical protein [Deinococcus rubellus]
MTRFEMQPFGKRVRPCRSLSYTTRTARPRPTTGIQPLGSQPVGLNAQP